jgi:hypothetical protein
VPISPDSRNCSEQRATKPIPIQLQRRNAPR